MPAWRLIALAVTGVVIAGLGSASGSARPAGPPNRPCPTASVLDAGSLAWVEHGALRMIDLRTCAIRTLVARGATGPVHISPDGRWVGFGPADVVPAKGGRVLHPLGGQVTGWQWSPLTGCKPGTTCVPDQLAGVTQRGAVVTGAVGASPRVLLPARFQATGVLFDPRGILLATGSRDQAQQLWAIDTATGHRSLAYRTRSAARLILAATDPLFEQVAFWVDSEGSASLAADGLRLVSVAYGNAAPGQRPLLAAHASLPYPDFLTSCGSDGEAQVLVSGAGRDTTTHKRLVGDVPFPKQLDAYPITSGARRSWVSPTCGMAGLAAAAGPVDADRAGFGHERRRIWLVRPRLRQLTFSSDPRFTDELPRFSQSGDVLTFIRTDGRTGLGRLFVILHPAGRHPVVDGPLAVLGPTGNYYGHYGWAGLTDYR